MIGEIVSHYRVLEALGAGGMGEVYLAEDLRLRRTVALKLLRGDAEKGAEARQSLLREARMASQLNHPNIGVIYEVDELVSGGERRSFIAMEHVDGPTLDAFVKTEKLGPSEIAGLVRQIADALAEAHARGVVHRDIKPTNVMVAPGRRVKVLDFGLATREACDVAVNVPPDAAVTLPPGFREDRTDVASGHGGLAGTIAYMSPEQAAGEAVDARSDVFSLGVVLFELLAGRRPFEGETPVEVLTALLRREAPRVSTLVRELPYGLDEIVSRALAKDRTQRIPSMRAFADALRAVERGIAGGTAVSGRSVAVMSFSNITGSAEDDWIGTGVAETVTNDLKAVPGVSVVARGRIAEVLRRLDPAGNAADDEVLAIRLGREVGARWVVGGGYQRLGTTVRLTARVVDVPLGEVVRTVKLDGPLDGIFALQDRIVAQLGAAFVPYEVAPATSAPVADADADDTRVVPAYEAYAKGLLNLREESPEALDRAILLFERAVALDPAYARAHLSLGTAVDTKATFLVMPELLEKAEGSFRRALALRPAMAEAWRELGSNLVTQGRDEEGLAAVWRALELEPDEARSHGALGRALFVGKGLFEEGMAAYERALSRNPQAGWYALQLSHAAVLAGDLPKAEAAARRAIELQEEVLTGREGAPIVGAYTRLGHVRALQGRYPEALEAYERELKVLSRVDHALRERHMIELQTRIGSARSRMGEAAAAAEPLHLALAAFDRRVRMGADDPATRFYIARAHALLGDADRALESLAKAVEGRPGFTRARARKEPDFEVLRPLPAFRSLIDGPAREPVGESARIAGA